MFFGKKIQRSFETSQFLADSCCKKDGEDKSLPLEKRDGLAIFLSALIVFGPLLLIIGGLAFWLTL